MTSDNENVNIKEQIKNKKMVPDDFYSQLKAFLEKDEFDIFKTKSKIKLESKFKQSNSKIQKLLDLKQRSTESIKKLSGYKKTLKQSNTTLKESIIKKLDLEVA